MNIGNKLTVVKNFATSSAGRQLLKTQKHSPTILFGAGVIGVVATAVLASKATLHLEEIIEEADRKRGEAHDMLASQHERYTAKEYTQDVAKIKTRLVVGVARLYAPAIIVGAGTIGAFGGSHVILTRRNAGLMAAYAALDKAFGEYRGRVTELVGPDKERELRYEMETKQIHKEGEKPKTINAVTGKGMSEYARLFSEETSTSWEKEPDYMLVWLKSQQSYMNDRLRAKGHVFLNDVYDALGLERTKAGAVVGWVYNNERGGDNFIDFGIYDDTDNFYEYMVGGAKGIWLDFNVDGVVYDLL